MAGSGAASCAEVRPATPLTSVLLKSSGAGGASASWCSFLRPASLQGVHFENVETLLENELIQPTAALS